MATSKKKEKKTKNSFNDKFRERNKVIGERLKEAREDAELTQGQLAAQLEISRSYLNKIERGACKIPAVIVKGYCDLTYAAPEWILSTDYGNINTESGRRVRDDLYKLPEPLTDAFVNIIDLLKK